MKLMAAVITLGSSMVFAQENISGFKWKSRLLIFPDANEALLKRLEAEEKELAERDLRVFIVGGDLHGEHGAPPALAKEFRGWLALSADPMVSLIGKDGSTTLSWSSDEFTFAKLYASIDAMPMRRREMRDGR